MIKPDNSNFIIGSCSPLTTFSFLRYSSNFTLCVGLDMAQLGNKSVRHNSVVNSLFFIFICFVLFNSDGR